MRRLVFLAIAASCAVSTLWVFVVPVFQFPDEDVHFDYAISIFTAKRLLFASEKPIPRRFAVPPFFPVVHPYTWHLRVRTETMEIKGRRDAKVPPGYGSRAFFRRIEATRPTSAAHYNNPWIMLGYPCFYYVVLAGWMRAIWFFDPSLPALFFGARMMSVLLLAIGLYAAFAIVRRLGAPPARAVLFTAAIGLFPLTSFVSAAVQPDMLAFALVNVSVWIAVQLQQPLSSRARRTLTAALGLCLALLWLTKYHTALCVFLPVVAYLLHHTWRLERSDFARVLLAIAVPLLFAAALQLAINRGMQTEMQVVQPQAGLITATKNALIDYAGGGFFFKGFWWLHGWNTLNVVIGTPATDSFVKTSLLRVVWIVLAAAALRMIHGWLRAFRLHRRGATQRVIAALLSNVFLNSCLLFAAVMLALHVVTNNFFLAQGRQWFPFLAATLWLGVFYVSGLFRRRAERALSWVLLLLLFSYSAVTAYCAFQEMVNRFYV